MKIVEKKPFSVAVAEVFGFKREVRTDLLEDVNIGDYVIVHAGFAIQKLDEKEAKETLKLIGEVFKEELNIS